MIEGPLSPSGARAELFRVVDHIPRRLHELLRRAQVISAEPIRMQAAGSRSRATIARKGRLWFHSRQQLCSHAVSNLAVISGLDDQELVSPIGGTHGHEASWMVAELVPRRAVTAGYVFVGGEHPVRARWRLRAPVDGRVQGHRQHHRIGKSLIGRTSGKLSPEQGPSWDGSHCQADRP